MCGIAGYLGVQQEGLVDKMLNMIRYRGPDDCGRWIDEHHAVALGHVRLSILDLTPNGVQPMWDDTGRYGIVYNGEIYNYKLLRGDLEKRGCVFRSNTDTEVLLNLYREKGVEGFVELKGIWAFAIWDKREERLLLSRDPMGVKPLYFMYHAGMLLFSSEIKTFLCCEKFSADIDFSAMLESLLYLWTPGPKTMFSHVCKLLPGQVLTIRPKGNPQLFTVDYLPATVLPAELNDEGSIVELLQEYLRGAVKSQLVSDVPVGAFLSGGLDSSAVVAFAEQGGGQLSRCYTMSYGRGRKWEGMVNDLQYARKVARHIGVECVEVPLDYSICHRVREMLWHLDEPQADLAPLNVLLIAETARANGDYVLLSGAGGDDIFSGYRRHLALHKEYLWSWLPYHVRRKIRGLVGKLPASFPTLRRAQKIFANAHLTPDERLVRYFAWSDEGFIRSLLHEEVGRKVLADDPFSVMDNAISSLPPHADSLSKMLYLERLFFLTDHNLNYTDKMGMARGVEIRVPLLDVNVVKFAQGIPSNLKVKNLTAKYIFKRAMEGTLPQEVIYRPKTGFVAPVREWVTGPMWENIMDVLSPSAISRRGWFSQKNVQKLLDDVKGAGQDRYYQVLALYCLEEWARMFLDGEYPGGVGRF